MMSLDDIWMKNVVWTYHTQTEFKFWKDKLMKALLNFYIFSDGLNDVSAEKNIWKPYL